ncbi:MAG: hypothetical protein HYW24_02255 [Candidatus Aenigmarchaeota archaeon]|nr:hypothetical protein [Candidatus Aenigmarchaeota archaeon]
MDRANLHGKLKTRYWSWLGENWQRIDDYRRAGNTGMSMHPAYGIGTTRFTDPTQFTKEFERYLNTPDAIRNSAKAIAELEKIKPDDYLVLSLVATGHSSDMIGEELIKIGFGKSNSNVQKRKKRVFEYLFSRLPNGFTWSLENAGIIDSDSRRVYDERRGRLHTENTNNPTRDTKELKREMLDLYRPEYLSWILRLDNMPDKGDTPDKEIFERRWPRGTPEGDAFRHFGYLAGKYKKRMKIGSYDEMARYLGLR